MIDKRFVLPFLLFVTSCSRTGGSDIDISIDVAPELRGDIRIVTATGRKPGSVNPVETVIVLQNKGDNEMSLLLEGSWHDARGGFFGGVSTVRTLTPGDTDTFHSGTRSQQVVALRLAIRPTDTRQDELLTETLASATPKAQGHGITYTESPTEEVIPAWTARGVANGQPFTARTIVFTPVSGRWKLEISDREFDPLQGTALARQAHRDQQTIRIDLPYEPDGGAVFDREMAYGGGYFQIKPSPSAEGTTSWNTAIAWFVRVTDWDRQDWVDGAGTFQHGGTASGELYISFRGSEHGIANSWISGTFEDVPIVYYGNPAMH